jgi:hypothetical protein
MNKINRINNIELFKIVSEKNNDVCLLDTYNLISIVLIIILLFVFFLKFRKNKVNNL